MPILDAKNLKKSLGTHVLLASANVTIARGEKVGLVGDNGAGKSTLARILAGRLAADDGVISRRRGARVEYLEQQPTFPAGATALDAALSGLPQWRQAHDAFQEVCAQLAVAESASLDTEDLLLKQQQLSDQIEHLGGWKRPEDATRMLSQLGIDDDQQNVDTMSGGERRRVALASLLLAEPDLAILDEPTNHLDADTIEWLEGYLGETFQGAVLLITHDRWLLSQVVDRTLEISDGQLYSYNGGWEAFLVGRSERQEQEQRQETNRKNFLRTEIEWLRRQPKARTGKQKARIDRAQAALSVKKRADSKAIELAVDETRLGNTILETRDLAVAVAGKRLVSCLNFHLTRGNRVGIVGPSGAGKTSLLRTLVGSLPPDQGSVTVGKNTAFAYLDQLRSGLDEKETVMEAIVGDRPSISLGEDNYSSYSYLERFGFRGESRNKKVAALSGGERARVALARLLLSKANVLVLDEPTNDLDVMTLGALEELILSLKGAALVVSHDRYFLDKIATSVIAFDGKGAAIVLQGGYSAYTEWKNQTKKEVTISVPKTKSSKAVPKKLTYAEEIELAGLMEAIESLATQVAALEEKLGDPELHIARRDEAKAVEEDLAALRLQLDEQESRWLELEEKRQG